MLSLEPFEYVIVLFSLILGLGIAQILTGVADLCSNLRNVKTYLPHTVLIFNVFLLHIQEWWYSYSYMVEVQGWTLPLVMSLMTYPILLFLLARMLFPTGLRGGETNLMNYYQGEWRWFFGIFAGTALISLLQNVFVSGYPLSEQVPQLVLLILYPLFIMLNVTDKITHSIFLLLQAVGWVVYMIIDNSSL